MGLDYRIMSIGIIVIFFTAMMPFSAMVLLSFVGPEVLVLGIQQIFLYLGWFINPIIMIITAIIIMRVSQSSEFLKGVLAGIILALVYSVVILLILLTFITGGPRLLPFSGIEMPSGYMSFFYELILKAYVFCIAGGLIGAYSMRRKPVKPRGESFLGGMQ